jgi:hypothetical protein
MERNAFAKFHSIVLNTRIFRKRAPFPSTLGEQNMILIRLPILAVALWALVTAPERVQSLPAETCEQQSKCIKFHVELAPPGTCGIGINDCPVQICLIFDLAAQGCPRATSIPRQLHYACDNAGADQCVRQKPWNRASLPGDSVDFPPAARGACGGTKASKNACTPLQSGDQMCQVGKPGDVLYWTM